jgi:putative ABC transport system permease protein
VNISLFERVPEFGTMRALGDRGSYVVRLVLVECLLLGIIGAAIGVGVGAALASLVSYVGIPMPPPPNADVGYTAQIQLAPQLAIGAFAIGVVAAALAGVPSALRAVRIPVADALRQAI